MRNRLFLGAILLILIAGGIWYTTQKETQTISADTTIEGDWDVGGDQRIVLENNAKVTVTGNAMLDGEIVCKNGGVNLEIQGNTTLNGDVKCESEADAEEEEARSAGDVSLVVGENFDMNENAEIETNGSVQIVQSSEFLASTPEEINQLYEEIAQDTGEGNRIGPFTDTEAENSETETTSFYKDKTASKKLTADSGFSLIPRAHAQADKPVVVRGKIRVKTPPKDVKQIIVFYFPDASGINIADLDLTGPDGRAGESDKGEKCTARGDKGSNAMRFFAFADNLTVNKFTLNLGDGGDGGDAVTKTDCDHGIAFGGDGGNSGNFKMIAGNKFEIKGSMVVNPGRGGHGGDATAYGRDGGPGEKGGDATATGGDGADNKKQLTVLGTVAGTENVEFGSMIGGNAGNATARPGDGGDGEKCGDDGGDGGNGDATGGDGGDASLVLAGNATRSAGAEDNGGHGGDVDAEGALGGDGGDCDPSAAGGTGGDGGDAQSEGGVEGSGNTRSGLPGVISNETGGDGGDGGDGCGPGNGGNGGSGDPAGDAGEPGENLCQQEQEDTGTADDSSTEQDQQTDSTGDESSSADDSTDDQGSQTAAETRTAQVIQYGNTYIEIEGQLIAEVGHDTDPERACGGEHWHSLEGIVVTTDGENVFEPNDPCGFGLTANYPVMEIQIKK